MDRKLRVWIDGCAFENTHQSGVWRVFYENICRSQGLVDYTLWLQDEAQRPLPAGVGIHRDQRRHFPGLSRLGARSRAYVARRLPPPKALADADVFHSSYFTSCPRPGPREVTTVHDMIPERFYSICGNWAPGEIERKRLCILKSDVCICVSHATARNLISFYPQVAPRVRVVHHGADHLQRQVRGQEPTREPFALFVGNRDFYKNFALVLDALQRPEWPPALTLRVVGPAFASHETALITSLGVAGRISHLGRVSDEELTRQYRLASCVLIPSIEEGFCLPVLEAQMGGCPVVASDVPVFHEVAGSAALFFDPRLGERLAEAAASALEPEIRTRLSEEGYTNAMSFTWARAADQIVQIYAEVGARAREA